MKEDLKKKYDGKDLAEIEAMVRDLMSRGRENFVEMVEVLIYLKASKRYKQNPRYARETFSVYVEDLFGILPGTFMQWQKAVGEFPEETKIHGLGLVAKISRICGGQRAKIVFREITTLEEVRTNKGVPREKIAKIIEKNKNSRAPVKKEHVDYRALYLEEQRAHKDTQTKLHAAHKKIEELERQVAKLKETAATARKIRKISDEPLAVAPVA